MTRNENISEKRLKALGIIMIGLIVVYLWRMIDIQLFKHDHYMSLAQGQQRFEKTEIASRGRILVRDSKIDPDSYYPMAFDIKNFALWVVPRNVRDKEKTAELLAPYTSLSQEEIFKKIDSSEMYIPPLARGLSLDQSIEIKELNISGVLVMPEYSRYYPEETLSSHILGFVNSDGNGQYGFEGYYNNELKGQEGNVKGEKDTLGRVISLLEQDDPKDGASYVLTIDRSVQYFVEKNLKEAVEEYEADSGMVVIMDVETGGILAMAATPSFDPNKYKESAQKDQSVFINPVISHLVEPGSVFKPIIMASAFDAGVITPETRGTFEASVKVDNHVISTAEKKAFGDESMEDVIINSDNVAMVWISELLGSEKMYSYLKDFGIIDKTGIDLSGEVVGMVPALKSWRDINRATISFGQGVSVTPIQMVAAYAAIANNGKYVYPRMVDKIIYYDKTEKIISKQEGREVVGSKAAKDIMKIMQGAVDRGHAWRAGVAGFEVAGKTGTAQIPDPSGGYYTSDDYLGIFNHFLAGVAPVENPKYAMIVQLEKPKTYKYAESTAAPLFGEISSFLLNYYYRLTPDPELAKKSRLNQ